MLYYIVICYIMGLQKLFQYEVTLLAHLQGLHNFFFMNVLTNL